jgi:hypothetical protein
MNRRRLLRKTTLVLLVVAACNSSEEVRQPAPQAADDPILQRAPELALLALETQSAKQMHCTMADVFVGSPEQWGASDALMGELAAKERALCESLSPAVESAEAVLVVVREGRALPHPLFSFSFFDKESDAEGNDLFKETTVGPFASLDACESSESVVRRHRIPTRRCAEWKPLIPLRQ